MLVQPATFAITWKRSHSAAAQHPQGVPVQAFAAHKESVRGVCMAPGDLKFATASDDSTVKVRG